MKMGRRPRCSSVTYRFRYAPSTASPARTALPAAHFDRNATTPVTDLVHPVHQVSDWCPVPEIEGIFPEDSQAGEISELLTSSSGNFDLGTRAQFYP